MSSSLTELMGKCAQVSDIYAKNCDINRDDDWYVLKLQEELGELVAEYLKGSGRGRAKGMDDRQTRLALENEAADVLASLLLFCRHNNIDLDAALERKWFSYLPTTEERMGD